MVGVAWTLSTVEFAGWIRTVFAIAALIASAGLCAGQEGGKPEARNTPLPLLDEMLGQFGPDSRVIVSGDRMIVTSRESFVQDSRSAPIHELICERAALSGGAALILRNRPEARQDLYPAPEGFCETLQQAFHRRAGERP